MDDSKFSEDAFNTAKQKGEALVKSVGYKSDEVPFVPVSGWTGDNLVKKSENMPWYKGKTLLETFDDFKSPENQLVSLYVYQYKMFIQLLVLALFQLDVLKPEQ